MYNVHVLTKLTCLYTVYIHVARCSKCIVTVFVYTLRVYHLKHGLYVHWILTCSSPPFGQFLATPPLVNHWFTCRDYIWVECSYYEYIYDVDV